jgi:hypothetical protein
MKHLTLKRIASLLLLPSSEHYPKISPMNITHEQSMTHEDERETLSAPMNMTLENEPWT